MGRGGAWPGHGERRGRRGLDVEGDGCVAAAGAVAWPRRPCQANGCGHVGRWGRKGLATESDGTQRSHDGRRAVAMTGGRAWPQQATGAARPGRGERLSGMIGRSEERKKEGKDWIAFLKKFRVILCKAAQSNFATLNIRLSNV